MTPQPALAMHLTLDPATTDEALATIFGALRRDPERSPAQHQSQRDAGAMMIAALHPNNPVEAAYAVQATAAHFATMECFRRTTLPDTPDVVALRWCGKALALSRMAKDMIRALEDRQEAAPQAQQQIAVRTDEDLSQALAAEVARRAAAARAKSAETQAVPRTADRKDPVSSERPSVTPADPAIAIRPAAAVAAKMGDWPASNPASDLGAAPSTPDPRDPLSSERPRLLPPGSAIMSGPAAVSCLAPALPRPGLRAALLSSTSLCSRVVPMPATPTVTPAKPAGL